MPCVHEFGILPAAPRPGEPYEYTPERYRCVSVEDDDLQPYGTEINRLDCYWDTIDRPEKGLAWYGITLIPPETLPKLLEILEPDAIFSEVCRVLRQAHAERKFVIHYGP